MQEKLLGIMLMFRTTNKNIIMKDEVLKIVFKDDMAFLTEEVALDITQIQIKTTGEAVKFQAPAFWTIRVINFIENEKRLHAEILSYEVGETRFSPSQIDLSDILVSVEKITFRSIDTTGLLRTLNSKSPVKVLPVKSETVYRNETHLQPETKREPGKKTYNEPFSIPIKNVTFLLGKVSFEKKIQGFKKPVTFEIANESIVKAYDSIKNYFCNVLGSKNIQVLPTIIATGDVIESASAISMEIDRIDKSLIEEVKLELVKTARKKEVEGDAQLLTMEECLVQLADDKFKAEEIFKNDNEFLEKLLQQSATKHHSHLRYLSSKHRHDLQKLRYVHSPFSFVFVLGSTDNLYVVWETLDTEEATYIWTFAGDEKSLQQFLLEIGKTINLIKREGRNEYISLREEHFKRVRHDYSDLQNGFKKWKTDIEDIII